MPSKELQAETKDDSDTQPIGTTSSHNNAKPIVVGSTAINELIGWCILNAFNIESQDGTKYMAIDYEEMQSQLDYFIEKEKYQIMRAYEFGEGDAYNFKKEDAEKYYQESYK
jgi:hypothetical protein